MTDADIAIQRLTAWVRDYGDSKPKEFIGDVSMLLMLAAESKQAKPNIDAIREAFEPFRVALETNETDTLGRLSRADKVLFTLSGSWTGSADVTLGDLRKLANAIRSSS
jgi:uncharacterized protein YigA (DUF484 family)